ncbi:MAG: hypothetical protein AAGE43_04305 [Pseudomonadota bacterium]
MVFFSIVLGACSGSAGTTSSPAQAGDRTLSGVVGSPSLSDATVTLLVDGGQSTVSARSEESGDFSLTVSKSLGLPLSLQVEGGTDVLTGQPNGVVLEAMSFDRNIESLRVSHLSTLAAAMARCSGEPTAETLTSAWERINERFDQRSPAAPANPTTLELAAELRADLLLAEAAERTAAALAASAEPASVNEILGTLACDLADDGRLNLSGAAPSPRTTSVYRVAEAAVAIEFLGADPHINGSAAASLIDEVLQTRSGDPSASLRLLGTGARLPALSTRNLTLLLGTAPDDLLLDLLIALADGSSERVSQALGSQNMTNLWALAETVALFDGTRLAELVERVSSQGNTTAPLLAFSAEPTEVERGADSTLSWASSNAEACRASDGWSGRRALTGIETMGPLNESAAYTLSCAGLGGLIQAQTTVAVVDRAARPVVSLSADDPRLTAGQGTIIRWTSANATSCRASGAWQGDRPVVGSEQTGNLSGDRDYTLVCSGPGGSDTATLRINVDPAPQPVPTLTLNASPGTVDQGDNVRLSWNAANATSCQASGAWSGSRATSGSENSSPLSADATFTLRCSGAGGTVTRTARVSVTSQPAPTLTFSTSSGTVDQGDDVRLSWNAANATSCQASGAWSGSRSTSGSESRGPLTGNSTFTLRCTGPGGSVSRSATVSVRAAPAPDVSLTAEQAIINSGASVRLSWSVDNATSCQASGGWSGSRGTSGSQVVGPINAQTTFSLSCSGPGGSALDMVAIRVNGTATLNWQAPTENVDGSALTDLAGYRVYYGDASRSYTEMTDVANPGATSVNLTLPSGDYYVAMTALDAEGNESAYSNEVLKQVP